MKRPAQITASILLMSLLLSACGGDAPTAETTSGSTSAETTLPADTAVTDDLPDEDFGGYEFRILSSIRGKATLLAFPEEQTGDTLDDAYYKRNLEVSQRFNVKFTESTEGDGLSIGILQRNVMAGDDAFDLYQVWDRIAIAAAESGLICSIEDVPEIDLDKPYWSSVNEQLTIGDKLYFAVGDENPVLLTGLVVLLYNKDMARDLGIGETELYDLVRDGKWTIDRFFGYADSAIRDVNGNQQVDEDDIFGVTTQRNCYFMDFITASGAKIIDKNEDDIPYLAFDRDTRFADVYDLVMARTFNTKGLFHNVTQQPFTGAAYAQESDQYTQTVMHFGNGHALFCGMTLSRVTAMREYETDYGVLPFPGMDEVAPGTPYIGRTDSLVPYVIPTTNSDLHRTGVILEALACAGHNIVVPAYYNVVLGEKETRDEASVEMLEMMFANRRVELEVIYWATRTIESLCENNVQGFASQIESLKSKLNDRITTTAEAFAKLG